MRGFRPQRSRVALVSLAALALAVTSACGSSAGSSSTSATTGSSSSAGGDAAASLKFAEEQLASLYQGTYVAPEGEAITPPTGKKVWAISVGQDALSPVNATQGLVDAGKKLGWEVTVFDGKFDPTLWLAGIRQAIQAKADGIFTYSFDCAPVKAALQEAKAANIPVVLDQGADCGTGADSLAFVPGYSDVYDNGVITTGPVAGTDGFIAWNKSFGATGAWWLVHATKGEAKVINFVETDIQTTVAIGQGVKDVIARCATCEIVAEVDFTGTELGPQLQQKAAQALLQHPEANAIHANYDTAVTSGIAAAVRASGRKIFMAGGEGFAPNMDLVRQGIQNTGSGYAASWEGWAGADALARMMLGKTPVPTSGIGVQAYDIDHNMPPAGQGYQTSIDYQAAYLKLWGLG